MCEKRRRALRISPSEPISWVGPPQEHWKTEFVWCSNGISACSEEACHFPNSCSCDFIACIVSCDCLQLQRHFPQTLSQSPWELGSAGVTCVYQWGSAPEEHRPQRPWEEGSAHWVWNHASLDAEGLGWCQVKQNGLWKHHCLRRFQEGVWSAGKARAWAPAPSLAMLPLVSLSHRLCCPAGREARWSLQFFSPLETCESKGALVRKLISVCLCNIYFIFTIYIIGWIIFVIILFWIITENI